MHKRVVDYMDEIARRNGFQYTKHVTHLNAQLTEAVWDQALRTEAEETGNNVKLLQRLAYELVHASRRSEMQGCYFDEPSEEKMEEYRLMFNHTRPALDYVDRKWRDLQPAPVGGIEFTIVADDESVLKLQPNVQLKLFDDNEQL